MLSGGGGVASSERTAASLAPFCAGSCGRRCGSWGSKTVAISCSWKWICRRGWCAVPPISTVQPALTAGFSQVNDDMSRDRTSQPGCGLRHVRRRVAAHVALRERAPVRRGPTPNRMCAARISAMTTLSFAPLDGAVFVSARIWTPVAPRPRAKRPPHGVFRLLVASAR